MLCRFPWMPISLVIAWVMLGAPATSTSASFLSEDLDTLIRRSGSEDWNTKLPVMVSLKTMASSLPDERERRRAEKIYGQLMQELLGYLAQYPGWASVSSLDRKSLQEVMTPELQEALHNRVRREIEKDSEVDFGDILSMKMTIPLVTEEDLKLVADATLSNSLYSEQARARMGEAFSWLSLIMKSHPDERVRELARDHYVHIQEYFCRNLVWEAREVPPLIVQARQGLPFTERSIANLAINLSLEHVPLQVRLVTLEAMLTRPELMTEVEWGKLKMGLGHLRRQDVLLPSGEENPAVEKMKRLLAKEGASAAQCLEELEARLKALMQ